MNKIIQVTNCNDCPFNANDNEYGSICNFPCSKVADEECNSYSDTGPPPNNCPLREGTVLVSLKKEPMSTMEIDTTKNDIPLGG